MDDYLDDGDDSVPISGSDEISEKEGAGDEVPQHDTDAKTVRKSKTGAFDNGLKSAAPNGERRRRRRGRGWKKRRHRRPRGRHQGGVALKRSQLRLMKGLIRALKHRKQGLRRKQRLQGGSAFRRGQLRLIEGLIRALRRMKQRLLGSGIIGRVQRREF